jgi:hypothetical protein
MSVFRFPKVFLLFLLAAVAVFAADVDGKWVAQMPGRDGQTHEVTYNFKMDGDQLTGTISGAHGDVPIADGKVDGDTISFAEVIKFNRNEFKILYKGKVAGDEIQFTRQREGANGRVSEFTAKKVS